MAERKNIQETTLNKYKLCIDEYYANGFKPKDAYQAIYKDANDNTANNMMSKIIKLPQMQLYIEQKNEILRAESEHRRLKLRGVLESWINADVTQALCLSADKIKELPEEVRKLVTGFETSKTTFGNDNGATGEKETIKLRFVSKEKAADLLSRHYGMFKADNEQQSNKVTIVIEGDSEDLD